MVVVAHQPSPSAKPSMVQSGWGGVDGSRFDGELCNGNWHGTLRVTLEDDIDDSTMFPAKVYDVIYPLLEKFTKARGLWLRDVGFWVNGATTKLTTNERAGCMGMEENDQILVRLNGRRRLVVVAEGEGQRHLFECVGGTRRKKALFFFSRSTWAKVLSCYITARGYALLSGSPPARLWASCAPRKEGRGPPPSW